MKNKKIQLGLKENAAQFTLLILINALVGGMVGLERSIFPEFAQSIFSVPSKTAILSFITAFGISKAIANYYGGRWANSLGRKNLLMMGWMISLPVPFILIYAPHWNWVIFANILLGISQGMTWSMTVVMKIDLVGEKNRGLAMGLNEFAGYLSVGLVAYFSSYIADQYGIRPYPFYLGVLFSISGLLISWIWVEDTRKFHAHEPKVNPENEMKQVFYETTIKNKTLSSVTQAGMVNNLNDGMIWGLLPMLLSSLLYHKSQIGIITAIYPVVWGVGQLFTGKMSDHYSKKGLIFWGMLIQGIAILLIPFGGSLIAMAVLSGLVGFGTAMVYPTFLNTIASNTTPSQRAESMGTFRLWRDLGYAFGAIISGITADLLGIQTAVILTGFITLSSALLVKVRMN